MKKEVLSASFRDADNRNALREAINEDLGYKRDDEDRGDEEEHDRDAVKDDWDHIVKLARDAHEDHLARSGDEGDEDREDRDRHRDAAEDDWAHIHALAKDAGMDKEDEDRLEEQEIPDLEAADQTYLTQTGEMPRDECEELDAMTDLEAQNAGLWVKKATCRMNKKKRDAKKKELRDRFASGGDVNTDDDGVRMGNLKYKNYPAKPGPGVKRARRGNQIATGPTGGFMKEGQIEEAVGFNVETWDPFSEIGKTGGPESQLPILFGKQWQSYVKRVKERIPSCLDGSGPRSLGADVPRKIPHASCVRDAMMMAIPEFDMGAKDVPQARRKQSAAKKLIKHVLIRWTPSKWTGTLPDGTGKWDHSPGTGERENVMKESLHSMIKKQILATLKKGGE